MTRGCVKDAMTPFCVFLWRRFASKTPFWRDGFHETAYTIHQMKKWKNSFFEWFEAKVCILKSEAVIIDQNGINSLGHPVYEIHEICICGMKDILIKDYICYATYIHMFCNVYWKNEEGYWRKVEWRMYVRLCMLCNIYSIY